MRTQRMILRGMVCVAAGILFTLTFANPALVARGQPPARDVTRQAPQASAPRSARADGELEQQANQAQEEIELMVLQLDAKKALLRIGEARLEDAKRWKAHFESLFRDGKVTEDRLLAAKDDVLMMEAHVAGEKADVKGAEMRLAHARRRLAYGEFPTSPLERRVAELEQRLAGTETKIDLLQHEVGRLRREQPPQERFGPR
jgi:hypothetical protein